MPKPPKVGAAVIRRATCKPVAHAALDRYPSWTHCSRHMVALQGVTQPPAKPVVPPATFGFVESAEILNSRAAMVRLLCYSHE